MGKRSHRDADRIRKLEEDARAAGGEEAAVEALLDEFDRVVHQALDPVILAYICEAEGNVGALFKCFDLIEQAAAKLHELRHKLIDMLSEEMTDTVWAAPPAYDALLEPLLEEIRRLREVEIPPLSERQ